MLKILIISMYRKEDDFKNIFNKFFKKKNIKCYVKHWTNNNIIAFIKKYKINAIILSGSQYRILHNKKNIATVSNEIFNLHIPILGICYGYQYMIRYYGNKRFIGTFKYNKNNRYYKNLKIKEPFQINKQRYLFTHHDYIVKLPKEWSSVIKYKNKYFMAYNKKKSLIGIQFHPENNYKNGKIFFNKWIHYVKSR